MIVQVKDMSLLCPTMLFKLNFISSNVNVSNFTFFIRLIYKIWDSGAHWRPLSFRHIGHSSPHFIDSSPSWVSDGNPSHTNIQYEAIFQWTGVESKAQNNCIVQNLWEPVTILSCTVKSTDIISELEIIHKCSCSTKRIFGIVEISTSRHSSGSRRQFQMGVVFPWGCKHAQVTPRPVPLPIQILIKTSL